MITVHRSVTVLVDELLGTHVFISDCIHSVCKNTVYPTEKAPYEREHILVPDDDHKILRRAFSAELAVHFLFQCAVRVRPKRAKDKLAQLWQEGRNLGQRLYAVVAYPDVQRLERARQKSSEIEP